MADEEELLDFSLDSLETDCKKIKRSESYTSFDTVESGQCPQSTVSGEVLADSPESPDEQMEAKDESKSNSGVFIVEDHRIPAQVNNEHSYCGLWSTWIKSSKRMQAHTLLLPQAH